MSWRIWAWCILMSNMALLGAAGCTSEGGLSYPSNVNASNSSVFNTNALDSSGLNSDPSDLALVNSDRLNAKGGSTKASQACLPEDLFLFERADSARDDFDPESLPKGLYLATWAKLLVEKRAPTGEASRLLMREAPGVSSPEIICSELGDRLGSGFEMAMSGPVKFDTSSGFGANASASANANANANANINRLGLVMRQFYVYSEKRGYGVIASNPKLGRAVDLNAIFEPSGGARLIRLNDRSYLARSVRERDGVRLRLLIRLERVSN